MHQYSQSKQTTNRDFFLSCLIDWTTNFYFAGKKFLNFSILSIQNSERLFSQSLIPFFALFNIKCAKIQSRAGCDDLLQGLRIQEDKRKTRGTC